MAMPGMGMYAAGMSPEQMAPYQSGEPVVYSGYWGRPVNMSQLPDYEKQAYGFPTGPQGPRQVADLRNPSGFRWVDSAGQDIAGPPMQGGGQGFGAYPGGGGGGGGSQSYGGGGDDITWRNAAGSALGAMYSRIRERAVLEGRSGQAARHIFNSGVGHEEERKRMHELDLNERADFAKLWANPGGGGGGSGGSPNPAAQGNPGPWNMGGFGTPLPGFNPMPGGPRVPGTTDGSRPGYMAGPSTQAPKEVTSPYANRWGPAPYQPPPGFLPPDAYGR